MINILCVCLGNICRSPTAHGILRHKIEEAGLVDHVQVDSAGTGDWHVGAPPDARAVAAAAKRGYQLDDLVARQVSIGDFNKFDYILAMDSENLKNLRALKPQDYNGNLDLLLEFGSHPYTREVPDPYYGGANGFETVLDLIEDASEHFIRHLREEHQL